MRTIKLLLFVCIISLMSCSKEDIVEDSNCIGCYLTYKCSEITKIVKLFDNCNKVTIEVPNANGETYTIKSDCYSDIEILDFSIGDFWCENY